MINRVTLKKYKTRRKKEKERQTKRLPTSSSASFNDRIVSFHSSTPSAYRLRALSIPASERTQSSAKDHHHRSRPRTYNPGILHRTTPTPDAEEKHQQNCSLSSPTRSRRDCRSSWFSDPHWISCLTWPEIYRTVVGNPLAWRANYLWRPIRHQRGDIYY